VPVESIAEDLLGLRIEERLLERSGTGGVGADAGRRERQRAVRCFAECDGVAVVQSRAGRGEARVTHPAGAVSRAGEAALGAVLREAGCGIRRGL